MSSKKKPKSSWVSNLDGSFTITGSHDPSQDCDQQEGICSMISPEGSLIARIQQMTNTKLSDSSYMCHHSILELNPDTMDACCIAIGSCVVLFHMSDQSPVAFRAWPNIQVGLGKVGLTEEQITSMEMSANANVEIIKCPKVAKAKHVTFHVSDGDKIKNINLKKLETYLKSYLSNRYIMAEQNLIVNFFGKNMKMICREIESASDDDSQFIMPLNGSFHSANESFVSKEDLTKSFLDMKISDSKENNKNKFNGNGTDFTSTMDHESDMNENTTLYCKVFEINKSTDIKIEGNAKVDNKTSNNVVDFNAIGGMKEQIERIKQHIILPLHNEQLFRKSAMSPSCGILLFGAPGVGKTLFLQALANECKVYSKYVECGSLLTSQSSAVSEKLVEMFNDAWQNSPSVLLLDDIDVICSKREQTKLENEKRLLSTFVSLLDDTKQKAEHFVFVVAATNRIGAIDGSLRRAGRFEHEIEIPIQTPTDRTEIIRKLLSNKCTDVSGQDIECLSSLAHGYVGADLAAVCREANMSALHRSITKGDSEVTITMNDLEHGLKVIPPSAMREILVQVPQVLWSDIGGNVDVKKKLRQAVEWPLKHPEAFKRMGIQPPRGVLLYGPPGCSKTLQAKALATESRLNFISIKGAELLNKYVGESEFAIRELFRKARSVAPSILFFDELDALATQRGTSNVSDRVLATLLTEMDGVETRKDVIVVAATNRPDMIDKALLRPGRIDRIIYVPLPSDETKAEIFELHLRKMAVESDIDITWLVSCTNNYSGAEITSVCREAAMHALEEDMTSTRVAKRHFQTALAEVKPQTSEKQIKLYEEYNKTLKV